MAAATTEPEGGLVIDGAAVAVVPSQVQSCNYEAVFGCVSGRKSVHVCAILRGLLLAICILLLALEYSDNQ